jgi:hypothetical protein
MTTSLIDLLVASAREPRPSRPEVAMVSDPLAPGHTGIVIRAESREDVLVAIEKTMFDAGDAFCVFSEPRPDGNGGWMVVGLLVR